MRSANVSRISEFYAAIDRYDMAAAMKLFAPDTVWVESPFPPSGGGVARGAAEIARDVLGPFVSLFSQLTVVRDRMIASGDDVVVLGRYRGVIASTGRDVVARFSHAWTLHDGLIVRMEQLADTAQLFLAAGYPLPPEIARVAVA
ncbi:MAG: nuclear transport factor 2 family protein [Phycisphaerales bacterium]|jgi:hypothetical protein